VEFPCVNWDVHGEAHRHIYCVADRVDHEVHWGPTQVIMKLTLKDPLAGTQVRLRCWIEVTAQGAMSWGRGGTTRALPWFHFAALHVLGDVTLLPAVASSLQPPLRPTGCFPLHPCRLQALR
jgi:hypothetical protein